MADGTSPFNMLTIAIPTATPKIKLKLLVEAFGGNPCLMIIELCYRQPHNVLNIGTQHNFLKIGVEGNANCIIHLNYIHYIPIPNQQNV